MEGRDDGSFEWLTSLPASFEGGMNRVQERSFGVPASGARVGVSDQAQSSSS